MKAITHAFIAMKPCGCPTFARLHTPMRARPLEQVTRGMTVKRVPLERANVVVCRCES
jgi:hypothetical protein